MLYCVCDRTTTAVTQWVLVPHQSSNSTFILVPTTHLPAFISDGCCAIVLTKFCWLSRTNIQTYKHLPQYTQPLIWWSVLYRTWLLNRFSFVKHTHRHTNTLKTIPAFAVAASRPNYCIHVLRIAIGVLDTDPSISSARAVGLWDSGVRSAGGEPADRPLCIGSCN